MCMTELELRGWGAFLVSTCAYSCACLRVCVCALVYVSGRVLFTLSHTHHQHALNRSEIRLQERKEGKGSGNASIASI
jgi:hypothetical protein